MKKNDLLTFTHEIFGKVRAFNMDGEPYFIAKDIADVLDYSETSKMLRRLDSDEKFHLSKHEIQTALNGLSEINNNGMTVINEPGFYIAVIGSEKKEAKQFKRWIAHEVLPALRKDGLYITENATTEQKLYHPDMLEETFMNCSIEDLELHYEKCQEFHKNKRTRLLYKRSSENRRSDKKKSIADSKIEIMETIKKTIKKRQNNYLENHKFEFAHVTNKLLKTIADDIWKVRHSKTKGKLAAMKKQADENKKILN